MTKKGPAWSFLGATVLPGPRTVSAWHGSELPSRCCCTPGLPRAQQGWVCADASQPPLHSPHCIATHPAHAGEEELIIWSCGN